MKYWEGTMVLPLPNVRGPWWFKAVVWSVMLLLLPGGAGLALLFALCYLQKLIRKISKPRDREELRRMTRMEVGRGCY